MSIIRRGPLTADNYTMSPNHWSRDPRLGYKAKGLLVAIAGHAPGYPLTVEQLIAQSSDGKDSINSGLKELEGCGYLRRVRIRGADGKLGGYDWELVESPDGCPSVSAGGNQSGKSAVVPGRKTRSGADQQKQGVSAGGNQSGFTTVGNPHLKRQGVEDQEEDHPPLPPAATAAPSAAPADSGEGEDQGTTLTALPGAGLRLVAPPDPELTPGMLAIVAAVREHQPGWRPAAIAAVLTEAVGAGRSGQVAAEALTALARGDHGHTISPRRLLEDGPWWSRRPVRAAPGVPGRRCPRHPGQPADNCGGCRGEQLAAKDTAAPSASPLAPVQPPVHSAGYLAVVAALRPSQSGRVRAARARAARESRGGSAAGEVSGNP